MPPSDPTPSVGDITHVSAPGDPARSLQSQPRPRANGANGSLFERRNAWDPHSTFIHVWNQILLVAMLYQFFILPVAVSIPFNDIEPISQLPQVIAFLTSECFFAIDVYVQMNTGVNEDGALLRDIHVSRTKYFRSGGFLLDAFTLLPLPVIVPAMLRMSPSTTHLFPSITAHHNISTLSLAWLDVHKFLRVYRLPRFIATVEDVYAKHFVALKLLKLVVITSFVTHILTCARFAFGFAPDMDNNNNKTSGSSDSINGLSWLPPPPPSSLRLSATNHYLHALHWTLGLLSGGGDGDGALPQTPLQFAFTLSVLLVGLTLFTYACAVLFVLSTSENRQTARAEATLNQLTHVLGYYRVPEDVQASALAYVKRYYADAECHDREVLQVLCPSIAKDIQVELLRDTVMRIPLFRGCHIDFITAVTSLLEMMSLPADYQLFAAGDPGDCMFVVHSGVLHVLVPGGIKVRELRKGDFVGEISVFSRRPRTATVITASFTTLYKLTRFHVERVLEGYPLYAALIARTVEKLMRQQQTTNRQLQARAGVPTTPATDAMHTSEKRAVEGNTDGGASGDDFMLSTLCSVMTDDRNTIAPAAPSPRLGAAVGSLRRLRSLTRDVGRIHSRVRSQSASNFSVSHREGLASDPASPAGNGDDAKYIEESTTAKKSKVLQRSQTMRSTPRSGPQSNLVETKPTWLLRALSAASLPSPPARSTIASNPSTDSLPPVISLVTVYPLLWPLPMLLLPTCIPLASRFYRRWLFVLQVVLIYLYISVPLQHSFSLPSNLATAALDVLADLALLLDLFITAQLEFRTSDLELVRCPRRAMHRYVHQRGFLLDIFIAIPYGSISLLTSSASRMSVMSLVRLLRVWRLPGHVTEYQRLQTPMTRRQRVVFLTVVVLMVLHLVACGFYAIVCLEGIDNWNANFSIDANTDNNTLPMAPSRLYVHALFVASTTLTTLGRPHALSAKSSTWQLVAALAGLVVGVVTPVVLVDLIHKWFTTSAFEQREFLAKRARIQHFLYSQNAPLDLLHRVNAFLDFWWAVHRGALVGELLNELPETIKRQVVRAMCAPALQTLALLQGVRPSLPALEAVFVDNVRFILYGQGEIVYRQGDYASGLFFLIEGDVCRIINGGEPRRIPKGGFFGTAALHLSESAVSYAERVTAISGCVLLFVAREHLSAMHQTFTTLSMALKSLETRLMDGKLASHATIKPVVRSGPKPSSTGKLPSHPPAHRSLLARVFNAASDAEVVFDPDAVNTTMWQRVVAVLIVVQCAQVTYELGFGVLPHARARSIVLTVLLETIFALDLGVVHGRIGCYAFGNKIMDVPELQRRFWCSRICLFSVLALLPGYLVAWSAPSSDGAFLRLFNTNKLLRLPQAVSVLSSLETQYLNRTQELRVFRLFFWTMLFAHALGCAWFSFRWSSLANPDPWAPSYERLGSTRRVHQYLAASFWSLGVMSGSATGGTPILASHDAFSAFVMLCGLALFAYILGSLVDVVELVGTETRLFTCKLSALRHLLAHFGLPAPLADKLKTYLLFQRFHSITQEPLLEICLPPSLLTDIRLVHLQPMIVKVAFLAGMEATVTRMLVAQFSQVLVVKDDFVCRYGETGSDMFFIFTGVVEVLVPAATLHRISSDTGTIAQYARQNQNQQHKAKQQESDLSSSQSSQSPYQSKSATSSSRSGPLRQGATGTPNVVAMKKVNELIAGSYFGEVALFTSKPRSAHALAKTSCVLYKLSRRSLELVFERYPEWKKRVLRIVSIQQEQQHFRNLNMAEQQHSERQQHQHRPQHTNQQREINPHRDRRTTIAPSIDVSKQLRFEKDAANADALATATAMAAAMALPDMNDRRGDHSELGIVDELRDNTMENTPDGQVRNDESKPFRMRAPPHRLSARLRNTSKRIVRRVSSHRSLPIPVEIARRMTAVPNSVNSPLAMTRSDSVVTEELTSASAVPTAPISTSKSSSLPSLASPSATSNFTATSPAISSELWIDRLLRCTDVQSRTHLRWLKLTALSTLFMALSIPYRLTFDAMARYTVLPVTLRFLELLCELVFFGDLWVNWNLKESHVSLELYERRHHAAYRQERLHWDALAAFPFDYMLAEFIESPWFRLNRCIKMVNFAHYIDEIHRRSVSYENHRFTTYCTLFAVAIYWTACAYFLLAHLDVKQADGGHANEWARWGPPQALHLLTPTEHPSSQILTLRVLRSLFYAVTAFTKRGATFEPESEVQYVFALVVAVLGLLALAVLVAELAHLYVARMGNEVEFRNSHIAVALYLERRAVSVRLHRRARAFLTNLWSSHKGVNYRAILDDLPGSIRRDVVQHIAARSLRGFVDRSFSLVSSTSTAAGDSELVALMETIATRLRYEGYPRDESVVVEGAIMREMYFVVKGCLVTDSLGTLPTVFHSGDCFGESGLLGYSVSRATIRTATACDLLSLSSEALLEALLSRPLFRTALNVVAEAYRTMAQRMRGDEHGTTEANSDEPIERLWGTLLLDLLRKRQSQWAQQYAHTQMSAMHYLLLAPLRTLTTEDECMHVFENLLRLIVPHGSLTAIPGSKSDLSAADGDGTAITDEDRAVSRTSLSSSVYQDSLPVMTSTMGNTGETTVGPAMLTVPEYPTY